MNHHSLPFSESHYNYSAVMDDKPRLDEHTIKRIASDDLNLDCVSVTEEVEAKQSSISGCSSSSSTTTNMTRTSSSVSLTELHNNNNNDTSINDAVSSSLNDTVPNSNSSTVMLRRRPRRRRSYSDSLISEKELRITNSSSRGMSSSSDASIQPLATTVSGNSTATVISPRMRRRSSPKATTTRRRPSRWLIRADHPLKILWDVLTVLLSVCYIYVTHTSIRDRSIRQSNFGLICDAWFLLDILLNFVTEYRTDDGVVLRQGQAVWARYLTTWFVVDALSLVPWESLYVKPIFEMQKKRHVVKKYFFRTKAVVRITRLLRGRHLRLFGRVAKHTRRHAGVGANRLLRLLIKYVPKYLLFYRNMKGVLAVRLLRQVHWMRKALRNFHAQRQIRRKQRLQQRNKRATAAAFSTKLDDDAATDSLTMEEWWDDDDDDHYYNCDDYYLESEDDDVQDESVIHIQLDDDIDLY